VASKGFVLLFFLLVLTLPSSAASTEPEVVSFRSGAITLQGTLYKPEGKGPFPAVVYNHGSAPGHA
jgi:carboxymethylenebutenolidase